MNDSAFAGQTLDDAQIEEFANELVAAYSDHVPVGNFTQAYPLATVQDAYAISSKVVENFSANDPVIGYKIGLTSKAAQDSAGVSEPDYGFIRESMLIDSEEKYSLASFFAPFAEPEVAFIMGETLPQGKVTGTDVRQATSEIAIAIEVIDSRYTHRPNLIDSIADNASSGALLLGTRHKDVEYVLGSSEPISIEIDGVSIARGHLRDVMGDPANSVAWLANTLREYGVNFKAGDIILSGSITKFVQIQAGQHVQADFGRLGVLKVPS